MLAAVVFAVVHPALQALLSGWPFGDPRAVLHGVVLGALAAPCALLERAGRRRGGTWVVGCALGSWAVCGVVELWVWPALTYLGAGGGDAGLQAAASQLSRGGELAQRVLYAVATGVPLASLTLVRAAGGGALAQVAVTAVAGVQAAALAYWAAPALRLWFGFEEVLAQAALDIAPLGLLLVGAVALADRLAWRSAAVPARWPEQALPWSLAAAALLVFPTVLCLRSPAVAHVERVALARRLAEEGGRWDFVGFGHLRHAAPEVARELYLARASHGDGRFLEYADVFRADSEPLVALLEHEDPRVRGLAVQSLGVVGLPAPLLSVGALLLDADASVRLTTLQTLLDPREPRLAPSFRDRFTEAARRSLHVQRWARQLLQDSDARVRGRSLRVIERGRSLLPIEDELELQGALKAALAREADPVLRARLTALVR